MTDLYFFSRELKIRRRDGSENIYNLSIKRIRVLLNFITIILTRYFFFLLNVRANFPAGGFLLPDSKFTEKEKGKFFVVFLRPPLNAKLVNLAC